MRKLLTVLLGIWQFFVCVISPGWLGIAYMNIVGYGKGYDYDLGGDKAFFMLFGWIMLVVWAVVSIPGFVWLTRKAVKWNGKAALLPLGMFLIGFVIGVLMIGPAKFAGFFGF